MIGALKSNWRLYLIEAWALGMFMWSAVLFTGWLELPGSPVGELAPDAALRRVLVGLAMGLTAVCLIYSGWGRRSGAHMNPALTLAFLYLGKIEIRDALWYIVAQFVGGATALLAFKWAFPQFCAAPEVNYVQTLPAYGAGAAFAAEFAISLALVLIVLYSSNHARTAPFTGMLAGGLVALYIAVEAPVSGMSMNPARSMASALAAGNFGDYWIYGTAPVGGMIGAAVLWKKWICSRPEFRCSLHGYEHVEISTRSKRRSFFSKCYRRNDSAPGPPRPL